jgi:hypothetical protein
MNNNYTEKRINAEIRNLMSDNDISKNGYSIELVDGSKTHLIVRISSLPETQYSGGIFSINIVLSDKYLFNPPICKFITNTVKLVNNSLGYNEFPLITNHFVGTEHWLHGMLNKMIGYNELAYNENPLLTNEFSKTDCINSIRL